MTADGKFIPDDLAGDVLMKDWVADAQEELDEVLSKFDGNVIINGNMSVNQRAGSPYTTTGGQSKYTLDRWRLISGLGAANILTQVAGLTDDAEFAASFNRTVAGTTPTQFRQEIEGVRTLEGEKATLSFDLKSETGGNVGFQALLQQNFGSGGSAGVSTSFVTVTATPVTTRQTITWTLASVAGKTIGANNKLLMIFLRDHVAHPNGEIIIGNVKLERGEVATPFFHPSPQVQMALCQRYLQRHNYGWTGFCRTATVVQLSSVFSVRMRTAPTLNLVDTSITILDAAGTNVTSAGSSIIGSSITDTGLQLQIDGFTGLTVLRSAMINQIDWLELDAEY